MPRDGLMVWVFRSTLGDCTNGGLTARFGQLTLTGRRVSGCFEPCERMPELVLIERTIGGQEANYAVPRELLDASGKPRTDVRVCFGGNFVHSSDGRFRDATGSYRPLPVHDRAETHEQAALLSR